MNESNRMECIHCHQCRENCDFLKKYQMDIGDVKTLKSLAYHCFLCGKCTEVCPKDIDGREVILQMRRESLQIKDYRILLTEKENYLFKNYKHASSGSVLFLGCNFPSFYPKTTQKIVQLFKEQGIGTVYDCCGKPVSELGLEKSEEKILKRIEKQFQKNNITELITLCPNCYAYLKPRLSISVTSIYKKIKEMGIGKRIDKKGSIFLPCPDRQSREWLQEIDSFFFTPCDVIENVQCCGLGGCASVKEPELAKGFARKIKVQENETIYVYCASCAGNLTRNGCEKVEHILTNLVGMDEKPDISKSLVNRVKTKFL
jgi:Fe-S oxidoreductase